MTTDNSPTNLEKVLVIDDELGPRESLRILLKKRYQVLCADSVDVGVQLLRQQAPDVIVMDIRMPGKNGIDGLREIRRIDGHVSVIMLTGFGALETAQEAIRLGANDYLKKPFDTAEMEEIIRRNVLRTQVERRRARAEETLSGLNDELMEDVARKDHMASLGQKSAEIAHDLRNPLTAVMGFVELLADDLRKSRTQFGDRWAETEDYLQMIEKNVHRCKDLTDMWLSLSRGQTQALQPLVLDELLQDIVKNVQPWASKVGVRIEYRSDCPWGKVAANRIQLFRALSNVLVNAVEAISNKDGLVSIFCRHEAPSIHIEVVDSGCGMDAGQVSKVFEPYYTTKEVHGTGLGLFITRKVIEEHKGRISLESQPGKGTRVTVQLPLVT